MNNVFKIKKKQIFNFITLLFFISIFVFGLYFLVAEKGIEKKNNDTFNFASPIKNIDRESALIEKTEAKIANFEKETDVIKREVAELIKEKNKTLDSLPKDQDLITNLTNRIFELESKFIQKPLEKNRLEKGVHDNVFKDELLIKDSIRDDVILDQTNAESFEDSDAKNSINYIPAGTFVKAVALGGADASAAVNAQSNPIPMLFRIIENGNLPNDKTSCLKGCFVTAAVFGDISSERGMIRLENLSCALDGAKNGIIDISVEGTVFGPEGKNGVRGNPIWREKALLQRAFLAGSLSGFANGLSQRYVTNSVSPLGATQNIKGGDIMRYGAVSGASNAMEKLAEYNIQRAEQYHPVLQIDAGMVVDLVFLKGFNLESKKHDKAKALATSEIIDPSFATPKTANLDDGAISSSSLPSSHLIPPFSKGVM